MFSVLIVRLIFEKNPFELEKIKKHLRVISKSKSALLVMDIVFLFSWRRL